MHRIRKLNLLMSIGLVVGLMALSAGVARADNINDTIADDGSGVSLTAGDPSPTNNTARVFVVSNGEAKVRVSTRFR